MADKTTSNGSGRTVTRYHENGPIFVICKTSEFFEKSPLSGAGQHLDIQVTSCLHIVSTNIKFDGKWKHKTSNFC